ncbi:MAG: tol-pal system-associated acyl-CoA thioesterase [Hyphomonadaceae bacterium]|nr:tol-pal system-associated acyl-CoA thioesterase [Hyphomonadaceae bacterium]
MPVRIYYEDTDFSGIVYHANYLRYFERGRSDFLRLAGVHHSEFAAADDPMAFAVHKMTIAYHRPARIDDALVVESRFETWKGPRLFVSQALKREGALLVEASVEVCCISLTGRARKPPALLLERLKPFLA